MIPTGDSCSMSLLPVLRADLPDSGHVSELVNKLVDLARQHSDHATDNFLQWFVGEQVEEEASADEVVQQLKLIKGEGQGLFMIDRELGQRVFAPPAGGQ